MALEETLELVCCAGPVVGGILGLLAFGMYRRHQEIRLWQELAADHGLQYLDETREEGEETVLRSVEGTWHEMPVRIEARRKFAAFHTGKERHQTDRDRYTRFVVEVGARLPDLILVEDVGFLALLAPTVGAQHIEVGVPEVDENYLVTQGDPEAVRAFFADPLRAHALPELHDRALAAAGHRPLIVIDGADLVVEFPHPLPDREAATAILDALDDVARLLDVVPSGGDG